MFQINLVENKMKQYNISDLIPVEDCVRLESFKYLMGVWRNVGSFRGLLNLPHVVNINGRRYLDDGNHRAVLNLINGIGVIEAEEEFCEEDSFDGSVMRGVVRSNAKRGIYCFYDLVEMVESPGDYLFHNH